MRDGRIELPTSVWKTDIIPFNQSRFRAILTKSKARRKQGTGFGLKLTAFFSYSSSSSSSQSSHSPSIITSPHFLQISSSSILFFILDKLKLLLIMSLRNQHRLKLARYSSIGQIVNQCHVLANNKRHPNPIG